MVEREKIRCTQDVKKHVPGDLSELSADLGDHELSGLADGLHGHGREPVPWLFGPSVSSHQKYLQKKAVLRDHSTNDQTSKDKGRQDIDITALLLAADLGAHSEGTEQGQGHKGSTSNGETLANSSSGVASSVEGVGPLADNRGLAVDFRDGHFGNTTGVVRDRSVRVNGKSNGQGGEHSEGAHRHTILGSKGES